MPGVFWVYPLYAGLSVILAGDLFPPTLNRFKRRPKGACHSYHGIALHLNLHFAIGKGPVFKCFLRAALVAFFLRRLDARTYLEELFIESYVTLISFDEPLTHHNIGELIGLVYTDQLPNRRRQNGWRNV